MCIYIIFINIHIGVLWSSGDKPSSLLEVQTSHVPTISWSQLGHISSVLLNLEGQSEFWNLITRIPQASF